MPDTFVFRTERNATFVKMTRSKIVLKLVTFFSVRVNVVFPMRVPNGVLFTVPQLNPKGFALLTVLTG